MNFDAKYNPLFGTTPVSDLFFTDYLPALPPNCVKLYMYCVYLAQRGEHPAKEELASALEMTSAVVDESFIALEYAGLLVRMQDRIILQDINQKALEKTYRHRTSAPVGDEFTEGRGVIKKRVDVTKSISDRFFSGQMPPTWYTQIDLWFDSYKFEPEVMFLLFQHCAQNHALTKPYVGKVAENWGSHQIKTSEQLEQYLKEYDSYKSMRGLVVKKLRLNRNLYEYEESVVEKWFYTYRYSFDIIEIALKKSVSKANASLATFDMIITDWFKNGLREKDEILAYEESRKKKYLAEKKQTGTAPSSAGPKQKSNYESRKYDDAFLDSLYKNDGGEV